MPLFNLNLKIPDEYKMILNKYIEIISIAIIFIILMDADKRPSLLDQALYLILGVSFYYLIIRKVIRIT